MGRFGNSRWLAFMAVAFILFSLPIARAQDDPEDQKRGVARISLINGEVSVRRGDSGEWVAAALNAPLMAEDRLTAGPNSRAEIQFDSANLLRIGGNAELRITQLDYSRYQMEIARGTVTFTVIRPSGINVEVDTPNISVRPSKQGIYRITVSEAGDSQVISRAGEVEVFTPRGSQWVNTGKMLMARGAAADPEYQIVSAPPLDEWDQWNQSRDRVLMQSTSYKYAPQGVYGVEELDNYGDWVNVDSYGWSWRPRVYADWSPYSVGRWAWEDWYGWTWISYDPWGWAPYHYGRWYWESRYGWCWYPGAFGYRHYWSPALVAFFGWGHGGGFGLGFGNIGWVPLAPHEPFHRWWGRGYYGGGGFNRGINITNVNVTNIYRNARVRNGISGVAEGDFRGGRFNNVGRFSGNQLREVGLVRGAMPLTPTNANLRFSDRSVGNIPRSNENTRFFTQQKPNSVARGSFAAQQRMIEQHDPGARIAGNRGGGAVRSAEPTNRLNSQPRNSETFNRNSMPGVRTQDAPGAVTRPTQGSGLGSRPAQGPNSWRRFGEPAGQSPAGNGSPRNDSNFGRNAPSARQFENQRTEAPARNSAPVNRGPWQRFGDPGSTPRQSLGQPRENPQSNRGIDSPRSQYQRGDPQSFRTAPPVVRERPSAPSQAAPRSYSSPGFGAPNNIPQRQNGGGEGRQYAPGGGGRPYRDGGSMSSPRQFGGGGMSASPRSYGGGGMSAPPRSYSQPSYNPGNNSRPSGGFGGGGGRPSSGGAGMSSPRSSGGGSSGGGSNRSSGGGGHGGGGGHSRR